MKPRGKNYSRQCFKTSEDEFMAQKDQLNAPKIMKINLYPYTFMKFHNTGDKENL